MNRVLAAILGALTVVPLVYMAYFFWMASHFMSAGASQPGENDAFEHLFALHVGTMLLIVGLLAFYVPYLFRTNRVPQEKKSLWAIVLFMGSVIAMPIFWYHYIWKRVAPAQRAS